MNGWYGGDHPSWVAWGYHPSTAAAWMGSAGRRAALRSGNATRVQTMDANIKTGGAASRLATAIALGCDRAHPTRIGGELYGYPDRRAVSALAGVDAKADGVQVDRHGRRRGDPRGSSAAATPGASASTPTSTPRGAPTPTPTGYRASARKAAAPP